MAGYQIADEPAPGPLARFAVNPIFPLLSVMIGGVWIAWPWFAFNSVAVGSPTLRRELAWLGFGLVGLFVLAATLIGLADAGVIVDVGISYAFLFVAVGKIATVYAVFVMQSHTIEIYQYYGGVLRNGVFVLVALFIVDPSALFDSLPLLLQVVIR